MNRKNYQNWFFLSIIIIIYLIVFLIRPSIAQIALSKSIEIALEILPIILVVLVINFIIAYYLKPKKIVKYLGKEAGIKGWIISIISGILSMGPIYTWYPTLKELKTKGMKEKFIACFLYNRAIKLPLLPVMVYYFGLPLVVLVNLFILIFSIINGLTVEYISKKLLKKQT